MQRHKSLEHEENETLRKTVRAIVDRDFDGVVSRAARGLGVSHSAVFEFLSGGRGAGTKVLKAVSDYTHRSIDELLGRAVAPTVTIGETSLGSDPDWKARYAELLDWNSKASRPYAKDVLDELPTTAFGMRRGKLTLEFLRKVCDALVQEREDVRDQSGLIFANDPTYRPPSARSSHKAARR